MRVRPTSSLLLLVLLAWPGFVPGPAHAADRVSPVRYVPPVPGTVVQPFDPPASTFGAGHRGVDLAAEPGDPVVAAGDGRVAFAGAVSGVVWVSIAHADGVTTSYGPLADLRVRLGEETERAQLLGRLAPGGHGTDHRDRGLHWGARLGARYIDPLSLLEAGVPRPSLIGVGGWEGSAPAVTPYDPWAGGRWWGLGTTGSPAADRPGFAYAPNPNHLLVLGGLGTNSRTQVIDPNHLGYDPRSVTNVSYAGRHDEAGDADDPRRDQQPYTAADTWDDPRAAALVLAEQLRAQARREPGRAVDLLGHSMGGLTILWYLLDHHDPYDRSLPQIGNIVTIASPLEGSDVATVAGVLRDDPLLGRLVGFAQDRGRLGGDQLRLDAPAIARMTPRDQAMWELALAWEAALEAGTAGPLATGTRVLNLGGSRDAVVSSARTRQPDAFQHDAARSEVAFDPETGEVTGRSAGAGGPLGPSAYVDGQQVVQHRVLPGGHRSVLETEAIREVTWRFLAGEEVVESPGHVSRVVGGQIAHSVGIGAELYGIAGPTRMARNPAAIVPLDPPE